MTVSAREYVVSPDGDDGAAGTREAPLRTIGRGGRSTGTGRCVPGPRRHVPGDGSAGPFGRTGQAYLLPGLARRTAAGHGLRSGDGLATHPGRSLARPACLGSQGPQPGVPGRRARTGGPLAQQGQPRPPRLGGGGLRSGIVQRVPPLQGAAQPSGWLLEGSGRVGHGRRQVDELEQGGGGLCGHRPQDRARQATQAGLHRDQHEPRRTARRLLLPGRQEGGDRPPRRVGRRCRGESSVPASRAWRRPERDDHRGPEADCRLRAGGPLPHRRRGFRCPWRDPEHRQGHALPGQGHPRPLDRPPEGWQHRLQPQRRSRDRHRRRAQHHPRLRDRLLRRQRHQAGRTAQRRGQLLDSPHRLHGLLRRAREDLGRADAHQPQHDPRHRSRLPPALGPGPHRAVQPRLPHGAVGPRPWRQLRLRRGWRRHRVPLQLGARQSGPRHPHGHLPGQLHEQLLRLPQRRLEHPRLRHPSEQTLAVQLRGQQHHARQHRELGPLGHRLGCTTAPTPTTPWAAPSPPIPRRHSCAIPSASPPKP